MKPRVAVHLFGVRHYAGEVRAQTEASHFAGCSTETLSNLFLSVSGTPLWPGVGGIRCARDVGEEPRHFQRRHPQPAEGEPVGPVSFILTASRKGVFFAFQMFQSKIYLFSVSHTCAELLYNCCHIHFFASYPLETLLHCSLLLKFKHRSSFIFLTYTWC